MASDFGTKKFLQPDITRINVFLFPHFLYRANYQSLRIYICLKIGWLGSFWSKCGIRNLSRKSLSYYNGYLFRYSSDQTPSEISVSRIFAHFASCLAPAIFNPQAHILMCHLFISYPNYIFYYESVGPPVLHLSVDVHHDSPIDVAYIRQSLVRSFMTPTKKLSSYTLVMTSFLTESTSNQLLRLNYTAKIPLIA